MPHNPRRVRPKQISDEKIVRQFNRMRDALRSIRWAPDLVDIQDKAEDTGEDYTKMLETAYMNLRREAQVGQTVQELVVNNELYHPKKEPINYA